ncbi:metallophosphoesterase [Paenibacillus woosongensis]|uniref:Serine/threonine protein phosphatase n=1 Tax=Paenibacillus woosongensis TaxID=307580 RepID=A0ABQ4ML91_9BACL|nr:metallophosphoesterase [Paenibacillus woosongensis]GIP56760.1 serine/threonine protein phosphatase [Paenibacillus woosongensis]
MERTLVISDIHGCYREFVDLLEQACYHPQKDRLLLLGDYVSRGKDSQKVVSLVMSLVQENRAIALQGNHDYRFYRVINNQASEKEIARFFEKGGEKTLQSYCKDISDDLGKARENIKAMYSLHLDFLKSLPFFYEDNDYIYVHAGINPQVSCLSQQKVQDLLNIKEEFYTKKTSVKKIVIFGHTVTKDIHGSYDIWLGGDKIGIDGGCSFGGQLNCLELVHGQVSRFYSSKFGGNDQ